MTRTFLILLLATISTFGWCGTTTLDPDGGLKLDGKRWFPLGLYEIPENATEFRLFSEAGFNLVRGKEEEGFLNQAEEQGLSVWIPLGGASEVPDPTAEQQLLKRIRPIKKHPALVFWELPDEALWNCEQFRRASNDRERGEIGKLVNDFIRSGSGDTQHLKDLYRKVRRAHAFRHWREEEEALGELWKALGMPDRPVVSNLSGARTREKELYRNLLKGYQTLRHEDPEHLVWQNHAPRNSFDLLQKHSAYCDLIGCDIYPIPELGNGHSDLSNQGPSSVGDYTERFDRIAPNKGTLMVLQGFAWKDIIEIPKAYRETSRGREPTYLESRFMAYDAIVRGANGLCYWGTQQAGHDSKTWKHLVPVIQELASLQEFVAAPEISLPIRIETAPSWCSLDRPVICSARRVGDDWLFILVNEGRCPQDVRLTFPEEFAGRSLCFLYDNRTENLGGTREVPVEMGSLGVRLISTRPGLEVPELRGFSREIADPFQ